MLSSAKGVWLTPWGQGSRHGHARTKEGRGRAVTEINEEQNE